MKTHIVYFEIFGKKLKVEVTANNQEEAKKVIKSRIIFHKIERIKNPLGPFSDIFNKIFK